MSYYLRKIDPVILIKKENVPKLTGEFYSYFSVEKDEDCNIVDIEAFDKKYNFEEELQDNAALFENGSHIDCIGENGEVFRLLFRDGKMYDISGAILYPEDEGAQIEVNNLEQRLSAGLLETF